LSPLFLSNAASAETVNVKYRAVVELAPFAWTATPRSSFIQRVCFDKAQGYMLINFAWHLLPLLRTATGHGRRFHGSIFDGPVLQSNIKGSGSDGPAIAGRIAYRHISSD
jgi:hypothetical protein